MRGPAIVSTGGARMITVSRSALVTHSAQEMYALVADVGSYPQFLPWCDRAEVHESSDHHMHASIHIGFKGVNQSFSTENTHTPGESIKMRLTDGPFKSLVGEWRFKPLAADACKVELELVYEFANPLLARLVGPVFNHIANTMVDAFIRRADALAGS